MLICSVFSRVCLCVVFLCVRGRPPLWRGFVTVTVLVSEIQRVVNYTDFEKLCHIIEHGLQGLIAKNIEGESTEANDLSHIL